MLFFLSFGAVAVAVILLLRSDFNSELFFKSLGNVRPAWLIASVTVTFACYILRAVRWQVLLTSLKFIRLGPLITATLLGYSAIYALGRAGELVRPVWIARTEQIPASGSFAAILLERIFDFLLIVLLFAVSLAWVELPVGTGGSLASLARASWALSIAAVAALGLSMVFHKYVGLLTARLAQGRPRRLLETFRAGLTATSTLKDLRLLIGYSVLLWLGITLQFWLMLVGLNVNLSLPAATLTLVGSALGSIAQIPGIGGGFQAGLVFCLTTFFLIPIETAIAASLLAWIVTYTPTLLAGASYMVWKGISTRELLAQEPA